LARRAGVKTVGYIRFHNLRKWVASGLSRSGFNEWQVKYVLGKSIPMADGTYLQTLEQEVRERYPEAYNSHLNLETSVPRKAVDSLTKENEELKNRIQRLENRLQRVFDIGDKTYSVTESREQAHKVKDKAYENMLTIALKKMEDLKAEVDDLKKNRE
jgi:hypothetical protein